MPFSLPELPYDYSSLEPHIDAKTMEIHHGKHHAAYINNLNQAVEGTEWSEKPIEEIITSLDQLPDDIRQTVRNNGGGHYNHSLFWTMMTPDQTEIPLILADKLTEDFGSIQQFKDEFTKAATSRFGSGWAWLILDGQQLKVVSTPNQDNPKMDNPQLTILLGLDIWEHAYYLKYQNRRPDYIQAWWQVVNWTQMADILAQREG